MDRSERLISDTLSKHAADAPTDDQLLAAVHTRLHRRRTHRTIGAAVVAAAVVATALTASQGLTSHPQVSQAPGWRWESFRTVQVQVPSSWTQYISGPAPCTILSQPVVPVVGRVNGWPASRQYTCTTPVIPLAQRRPYLWFNDVQAPGIKHYDGGWTEETRMVGGVKLSVLTKDDALRSRILDSARPITDTDAYGCGSRQPSRGAVRTPDAQVTSASICEYWQGSLIAGSDVPADTVPAFTRRVLDSLTPRSQPMIPAGCKDPTARTFVVLLRADGRTWPIQLAYTRCVPYTSAVLDVVLSGPHRQLQPADMFDPVKRIIPPAR